MQLRSALRLMSVCLLAILAAGFAEAMTFVHLAGTRGGRGYEDGPAADARFFDASSISSDNAGNLYVSDYINCTLRKILPTGEVQTLAGMKGMPGTTDGRRSAARFWSPLGTAVDSHGNIFVIDSGWNIIRKVTPDGLVTTFAGSPVASGSHADGPGAAARFTYPQAIAVDNNDNLYVGDYSRLRKITPDGNVTTLAGDGTNGVVNGTGTAAEFYNIGGIAFDASTNSLVITETQHSVVRRVTLPDAVVTTIAGKVGVNGHTNANGLNAVFQSLGGIAVNSSGYMWVTETIGTIRTISPAGDVAELAGQYFALGSIDGVGSAARFSGPFNIAINKLTGGIYVADSYTIRQLSGATVTTFAGTLPRSGIVNGTGTAATFRAPSGLAFDSVNSLLYVADRENSVIRRVTVPAGEVTTFAGNGSTGNVNGNGTAASFGRPQGVALNPADGSLFVADTDMNSIRRIAMNGDVTLWAGSATGASGSANGGRLTTARFYGPQALAFDPPRSRLYVADAYNHKLRVIDITTGAVSDVIDAATAQPVSFGTLSVDNVAVDGSGNVYAGAGNKITKISATGNVSVLAGPGDNFIPGTAVDGTGSQARFAFPGPSTVAVDASGNGYVADIWGGTIRSITSAGVVQTVGGNWNRSGSADGTDAFAEFQYPRAVVRTNDGIIVADDMGLRISVPEIADAAIAPAGAPLGVPMQLGTTAHAATSWQWSVIRRPAGSSATFSSSIAETPTFTPDIADVYTFRLVATGPAGRRITTVSVTVTQTLDHFRVTVGGANAGSPANVAVQAVDIADNPMPFSGTVHFTSNDPNATLPANYTFPPAENGAHLFNPTFRRAGNDSFTVTEVLTPGTSGPALTGTGQVSVVPGSPAALGISAASPVRAGSLTTVTVTSRDSFGNATTGYLGTVHFVSSDSNATLPENYTFVSGDGGTKTFVATLRKPGVRSIGLYDVANGALNASTNVYVSSPLVNGDIDQSGGNDIYWRNYTNGANAVWLMNGPATTLIVNLPALPNISYRIEGVADFDGDGKPDILWRNPASGANALWLLDGANMKATVNLPALPNPDYHIAGTADFDGDGDPDIIWRNTFNGANALWIMNGTAFSSIVNLPGLANPDYHLESAADFDGDGKPDILWRNWSTGANALWIMNGTAFVSIVNLDALPNPQYHVGAIGDFDGDGKADIVWRNTNSGANAMWKMNGTVNAGIINFDSLANPSYEMVGPR